MMREKQWVSQKKQAKPTPIREYYAKKILLSVERACVEVLMY
jgi:hypothetical protein